jgi:hypothetical protein
MRAVILGVSLLGLCAGVLVVLVLRDDSDVAAKATLALAPESTLGSDMPRDAGDALRTERIEHTAAGTEPPASEAASIADTPEAPPRRSPAEEEAHFKWLRATLPKDELRAEHQKLVRELAQAAAPEVARRIADGEYLAVSTTPSGGMSLRDNTQRDQMEFFGNDAAGNMVKVVLPQGKLRELQALKQKQLWLEDLMGGPRR